MWVHVRRLLGLALVLPVGTASNESFFEAMIGVVATATGLFIAGAARLVVGSDGDVLLAVRFDTDHAVEWLVLSSPLEHLRRMIDEAPVP